MSANHARPMSLFFALNHWVSIFPLCNHTHRLSHIQGPTLEMEKSMMKHPPLPGHVVTVQRSSFLALCVWIWHRGYRCWPRTGAGLLHRALYRGAGHTHTHTRTHTHARTYAHTRTYMHTHRHTHAHTHTHTHTHTHSHTHAHTLGASSLTQGCGRLHTRGVTRLRQASHWVRHTSRCHPRTTERFRQNLGESRWASCQDLSPVANRIPGQGMRHASFPWPGGTFQAGALPWLRAKKCLRHTCVWSSGHTWIHSWTHIWTHPWAHAWHQVDPHPWGHPCLHSYTQVWTHPRQRHGTIPGHTCGPTPKQCLEPPLDTHVDPPQSNAWSHPWTHMWTHPKAMLGSTPGHTCGPTPQCLDPPLDAILCPVDTMHDAICVDPGGSSPRVPAAHQREPVLWEPIENLSREPIETRGNLVLVFFSCKLIWMSKRYEVTRSKLLQPSGLKKYRSGLGHIRCAKSLVSGSLQMHLVWSGREPVHTECVRRPPSVEFGSCAKPRCDMCDAHSVFQHGGPACLVRVWMRPLLHPSGWWAPAPCTTPQGGGPLHLAPPLSVVSPCTLLHPWVCWAPAPCTTPQCGGPLHPAPPLCVVSPCSLLHPSVCWAPAPCTTPRCGEPLHPAPPYSLVGPAHCSTPQCGEPLHPAPPLSVVSPCTLLYPWVCWAPAPCSTPQCGGPLHPAPPLSVLGPCTLHHSSMWWASSPWSTLQSGGPCTLLHPSVWWAPAPCSTPQCGEPLHPAPPLSVVSPRTLLHLSVWWASAPWSTPQCGGPLHPDPPLGVVGPCTLLHPSASVAPDDTSISLSRVLIARRQTGTTRQHALSQHSASYRVCLGVYILVMLTSKLDVNCTTFFDADCGLFEPTSITFAVNVKVKVQQRASIFTLDVAVWRWRRLNMQTILHRVHTGRVMRCAIVRCCVPDVLHVASLSGWVHTKWAEECTLLSWCTNGGLALLYPCDTGQVHTWCIIQVHTGCIIQVHTWCIIQVHTGCIIQVHTGCFAPLSTAGDKALGAGYSGQGGGVFNFKCNSGQHNQVKKVWSLETRLSLSFPSTKLGWEI